MSSRRRNGSVSRAAEAASKNRLHMDRNPQHSRITDPSNPAGRRKEIDNVMKRARQGSPGTWDRKLLEVEEKDPNRWRHTGYKQLYLEGSTSPSPRRSRTPNLRRSRSPLGRRSRTPMANRRSPVNGRRSPLGSRRSPIGGRRSPVGGRRSPIGGRRSPIGSRRSPIVARKSRSRSPIVRKTTRKSRSRSTRKSPRRTPKKTPPRRVSPVVVRRPRSPPPPRRESPRPRIRAPPIRAGRPPSPPDPRKSSGSGSSVSSCSDESCSVCSAKNKKTAPPPPKPKPSATASPRPKRPAAANNAAPSKAVQPTRELLKARESSKRSREEKVLEWQRSQLAVNRPTSGAPIAPGNIKREGERRPPAPAPPPGVNMPPRRREERGVSPAAIQAALADSESDSESDASSEQQPQRLTLSERFGKMAQWSADRSARLENMRITRRETTLHVRIERGERESSPDLVPAVASEAYPGLDPEPIGSYPEELLAVAPGDMPSWDDVRVRYDYYKKRGYLRGLTLSDYVKWEEWWYKYQEWLKRERAYERWAEGESQPVRRERRRRGGRHRRS